MSQSPAVSHPAHNAGPPGAPEPAGHKKVLVIDDTADIRMIITEYLKLSGFAPLTAADGQTGIQMAKEHLPDLIICDIRMPNMDGYATLTALREHEATATIPFIFLSGAAEKLDVRRGMELGADDYLTKPFTHQELMAAVNARLEKQADLQRQSERMLDELRGNITLALPHELRTPLNGILGLASLMTEDYATMPPQEVLESARFIHESALRLHRLIENFLVYAQIQLMASKSRKIDIPSSATPAEVQAVIGRLAQTIAAKYKRERDLKLQIIPCSLAVPEENLQKIVEELVDNAFKFSEAGKPVQVSCRLADHSWCLTVKDSGRGMTAEQIARIGPHMQFERKTYEQQGAGLGLFIAKRLTELLGGQFDLQSKPGVETIASVCFTLPGA